MVRGPNFPVAQIVRCLSECTNNRRVHDGHMKAGTVLRKEYIGGPLLQGVKGAIQEFKELHLNQFCVKITEGDNCIKIGDDIGLIQNILLLEGNMYLLYYQFHAVETFYIYPLSSSSLGVFLLSQLPESLKCVKVDDGLCKYVLLPFKDKHVGMPLLHLH